MISLSLFTEAGASRVRFVISHSELSKEKWRLPYSAVLGLGMEKESVEGEEKVMGGTLGVGSRIEMSRGLLAICAGPTDGLSGGCSDSEGLSDGCSDGLSDSPPDPFSDPPSDSETRIDSLVKESPSSSLPNSSDRSTPSNHSIISFARSDIEFVGDGGSGEGWLYLHA